MSPLDKYLPSDEWHEMRRSTLRGSDVTILLEGRHAEIHRLWRLKTGRAKPSTAKPSMAMLLGKVTEDLHADFLEDMTGRPIWGRETSIVHSEHKWLGASLDGLTHSSDGREAILEMKCISFEKDIVRLFDINRYEFEGLIRKRKWASDVILPLLVEKYLGQNMHNMYVAGLNVCVFSAIIGNQVYPVEIEFDAELHSKIFDLQRRFWDYVDLFISPDESVMSGLSLSHAA